MVRSPGLFVAYPPCCWWDGYKKLDFRLRGNDGTRGCIAALRGRAGSGRVKDQCSGMDGISGVLGRLTMGATMKRMYSVCSKLIGFCSLVLICHTVYPGTVHGSLYSGGDWGGNDLYLVDGDVLAGRFSNVGRFFIPSGATVYGNASDLEVSAVSISVAGNLYGSAEPRYVLQLAAASDLVLGGSLAYWRFIYLSGQSLTLNGQISLLSGATLLAGPGEFDPPGGTLVVGPGRFDPPPGGTQVIVAVPGEFLVGDGGLILEPAPVPLPAAAWLLGPGLFGVLGLRRRLHDRQEML
jgi:hypothetical protein